MNNHIISNRPEMEYKKIESTLERVKIHLIGILNKKGYGAFLSRHEVQGVIDEEFFELIQAFHSKNYDDIEKELKDLAVACIFGLTCIEQNLLEW